MKYLNGSELLPKELLDMIKDYAQGIYVYIPIREVMKKNWGTNTNYKNELSKRDSLIYQKHLEGKSLKKLEILYKLSTSSIRRIILKQKRSFAEMDKKINEIITNWNIQGNVVQIYRSVWSISDSYIIKVYDDLVALNRNITMLKTLLSSGIPVAEVIPLANENDYLEDNQKYYVMTKKLPGSNIVNLEHNPKEILYAMGKIISRLHIAFQKCEDKITWNNSLLDEMNSWIYDCLRNTEWKYISEDDYFETVDILKTVYNDLPKQLIHRDVHFGNFLFDNGNFSGYIDFDLSQKNIRIFDIAYFLTGILSDETNFSFNKEIWFDLVYEVIRGYEENIELTMCEKEHLSTVMKSIEILFTAFFLSINDEKCAENAAKLFHFIKENEKKICNKVLSDVK